MNLIIKLPPKAERDEIVKAWVNGIKCEDNFSEYRTLVRQMIESGHSHNGISCLFLHDTTTRLIRKQLAETMESQHADIVFALPIGMN